VDNGTEGEYGTEIELRGAFEQSVCARASNAHETSKSLADQLTREKLGWDGGSAAAGTKLREQGRSVCLCFEGGEGTVGTVAASVKNRTPVLIIQGTGRAADLIADCLNVFAEIQRVDRDDAHSVNQTSEVEPWAKLREQIKNLLTKPKGSESEEEKNFKDLFDKYRIWQYKTPSPKDVAKLAEQLRVISKSRMCLAYPLGATRASSHGRERDPVGIFEYIARCAMLGIERDFADKEEIPFDKLRDANSPDASVTPGAGGGPTTPGKLWEVSRADSMRNVGPTFSVLGRMASVRVAAAICDTPKMEELHLRRLCKTVRTKKAEELFGQSMQAKVCLPSLERLIIVCSQLYWVIVFSLPFCV
jgi:hypothetical protein